MVPGIAREYPALDRSANNRESSWLMVRDSYTRYFPEREQHDRPGHCAGFAVCNAGNHPVWGIIPEVCFAARTGAPDGPLSGGPVQFSCEAVRESNRFTTVALSHRKVTQPEMAKVVVQ